MSNALMKVLKKDDVNTLKEKVADLETQRSTLLERINGNEKTRAENAFAASDGDPDAQAAMGQANTDRYDLEIRRSDLNLALSEARKRLTDAEETAAADAKKERGAKINSLLKDRMAVAKKVDQLLKDLTGELDRMDELAAEVVKMHKEFRPLHPSGLKGIGDTGILKPPANADRLIEATQRLGLRQYFDITFINPAFDFTDKKFLTGVVSEFGIQPYRQFIKKARKNLKKFI